MILFWNSGRKGRHSGPGLWLFMCLSKVLTGKQVHTEKGAERYRAVCRFISCKALQKTAPTWMSHNLPVCQGGGGTCHWMQKPTQRMLSIMEGFKVKIAERHRTHSDTMRSRSRTMQDENGPLCSGPGEGDHGGSFFKHFWLPWA